MLLFVTNTHKQEYLCWFRSLQGCFHSLSVFLAAVPSLPSRPVITAELIGQSVHLRCSFIPPLWSQPLGFHVVWARHIGHSMKAEIRQEATPKPFSLAEMDGVHFRLGETVIPARPCWKFQGAHVEGVTPRAGNVSHGSSWPLFARVSLTKHKQGGNVCHIPLREEGGEVKRVAGWSSFAPHASHLEFHSDLYSEILGRLFHMNWCTHA